ncbi:MAG: hybrid sensor histidine kinase/response regulator [Ramlibacter sp.]
MHDFLAGGGPTGALLRAHDWASTPLGAPAGWPQPLKTLVGIMLASNQPMFVAWGPGRNLVYNELYAQVLADKHPAALGRDMLEVWYDIRDDVGPLADQVFRGESVQREDMRLMIWRHGTLEETYFTFFYSPVRDAQGAVAGLFCACTDISDRVFAQRRVRESEARLRGVLDNMGEAFALFDRGFRLVDVNDEGLRLDGRTREQLLGRSHWELYPGTERTPLGEMYHACMADGVPRSTECHYRWEDGRTAWLEVRASLTPQGLALFYRDITRRRRLEQDARLSAERVQLALEAGAIVGTWVWDVTSDCFVADARFARSFGLDAELCRTGLPLAQVKVPIHPDDLPRVEEALSDVLARVGPYRCEYRVLQADGSWHWVEANGHVERDAHGGLRFPGVLLDIESRRRVAAERDQATAMLRSFIEAVPGVVYFKDLEGRMLLANRGVAELLGKPPEVFLGRTDRENLEDKAQAEAVMANDRRIMASGRAEQLEEEVRRPDGTPALWLSTKAPMRDEEGRVIGLIGASVDISERKRDEEALRDSDRRKSEFLAVLSHELRNPLAPIRNGVHVLRRAPAGSPMAARALEIIGRQSDHLARLVDDLLDMTRISRGKIALQRDRVDLNELVRRAADDFSAMLGEGSVHLVTELAPGPLWLHADATRISQVIGNLLHNAIKFTPAHGTIRLSTRAAGGTALLGVRDTGVGMDPGSVDAMFEPFAQGEQTLARSRGGLGLGLPVVKGLVEMHGGSISARSAGPGQGAEFVVVLPQADEPQPPATADGAPARAGAGRHVLIVEDNVDAARTLAELLELEGHVARVATDGRSAIALASQAVPDLVLCDIGLPDMDGYAVARAIRAEPRLLATRLVALSGYAQPEDRRRSQDAGFDDHLAKPPDVDQLLQLIAASDMADR